MTSADIRMYRLNELGDCFLVTFTTAASTSRLLIDCGSFRNSGQSITRIKEIVADIATETAGAPLDVVVGTHQHNDHLSGFVHCEDEFTADRRRPGLALLARRPRRRDGTRARQSPRQPQAHNSPSARDQLAAQPDSHHEASEPYEVLNDILGFYGAAAVGATTRGSRPRRGKILKEIGEKPPLYLRPGRTLEMPGLPPGTVRVHVLGPPRSSERTAQAHQPPRRRELRPRARRRQRAGDQVPRRDQRSAPATVSREEQQYPFSERTKQHAKHAVPRALGRDDEPLPTQG